MTGASFNLREEILKEHSKKQCTRIVEWIGNDEDRFEQLLHLFLTDEYRVTQRGAWPLSYAVVANPSFLKNSMERLLNNLKKPGLHDAIKRNTLRIIDHVAFPKKYEGRIMNFCFGYLESPSEAVAVKALSLSILGKLASRYPEIIPELRLMIEEQVPHQKPAFLSQARRLLKVFDRS
jgi:hypothetical protein